MFLALASSALERIRQLGPLEPLVRSPSIRCSVAIGPGVLTIAQIGVLEEGEPYLQGWARAEIDGHRRPTSLTRVNLEDPAQVSATLGKLIDASGIDAECVNLVLPDRAARVNLLHLEEGLPSSHSDCEELLRWRLRRTTPFPMEEALLDWDAWTAPEGGDRVLAVAVRREILRQYEKIVESLELRVGDVTLESLAVCDLCAPVAPEGDWAILLLSEEGFVLLVLRGNRPLFYRCKSYHRPPGDLARAFHAELVPSMEYYRKRLGGREISAIYVAGPLAAVPELEQAVIESIGVEPRAADPGSRLEVPSDLGLAPADRLELAPCLGPALRRWSR